MRFFLSHGALDQGHSQDILDVISKISMTGSEISRLCHVVDCTEALYKSMYNRAVEVMK